VLFHSPWRGDTVPPVRAADVLPLHRHQRARGGRCAVVPVIVCCLCSLQYLWQELVRVRCFMVRIWLCCLMLLGSYTVGRCVTANAFVLPVLLTTEDWERELAKTLLLYSGCVDANVLQYTWPVNFDKYRILLVSSWSCVSLRYTGLRTHSAACLRHTQRTVGSSRGTHVQPCD
jgi:hypothetical protein